MSKNAETKDRIRRLNDDLRQTFTGGRVVMTDGVAAIPEGELAQLLERVRRFGEFTKDNDPHGEHDFGTIDLAGQSYFFKVDLYEEPNVKDANGEPVVTRVLTIMLANEY